MSAVLRIREIDPPPVPLLSFQYWRWLPNWHNHYGCPDCRKTCATESALFRHLRREHPRWQTFVAGFLARKRPRSMPLALLWRDPAFRARHAAAVREGTERYWDRQRRRA